ncbi:MAG: flagellar motor protein MotB, partial [Janthinobacterium lividum]
MSSPRTPSKATMPGLPSHDRWLLSYADFVTLLLAVFIVLFASLRHNHGSIRTVSTAIHSGFEALRVGSGPPHNDILHDSGTERILGQPEEPGASPGNAGDLAYQLRAVLGDAIDKHEVVVQPTTDGLTIRLQELGFFES